LFSTGIERHAVFGCVRRSVQIVDLAFDGWFLRTLIGAGDAAEPRLGSLRDADHDADFKRLKVFGLKPENWEKGLDLTKAMLACADPASRAQFQELQEYDLPFFSIYEPDDAPRVRFRRIAEKLKRNLLEKLQEGILIASGYSIHAPPDAKPTLIAPDRWRTLTPDFRNSTAEGSGLSLFGIRVFQNAMTLRSQIEQVDLYRSGLGGPPTMKHLIIAEFGRRSLSGEALSSLRAEAAELCQWSLKTHPDGPTPSVGTIQNQIRELHRRRFRNKRFP
jgi:hypothetical protein